MMSHRPLIVHLNANSLRNKAEEVRELISGAAVASIQDHRMASLRELQLLLPDFHVYGYAHDDSGPGSVLLIATNVRHRDVWSCTTGRHRCTAAIVELTALGGVEVSVASLYAPPNPPAPPLDPDLLDQCMGKAPRAIIIGDLNARHPTLGCKGTNSNGTALRDYLEVRQHVLLNDPSQPTFFHTAGATPDTIDWAVASPIFATHRTICHTGPDVGSDHLPLLLSYPREHTNRRSQPPIPRWRLRDANWEEFERELTLSLIHI